MSPGDSFENQCTGSYFEKRYRELFDKMIQGSIDQKKQGFEGSLTKPPGFEGSSTKPPGFEGSLTKPPGFEASLTKKTRQCRTYDF